MNSGKSALCCPAGLWQLSPGLFFICARVRSSVTAALMGMRDGRQSGGRASQGEPVLSILQFALLRVWGLLFGFFFNLFEVFSPVIWTLPSMLFGGFYQVTRKQIFLCLQQPKNPQKKIYCQRQGKNCSALFVSLNPRDWPFFHKTFHPIKSYFLSKVLMIKCSCTLFNGKFHSISCHLLRCKRFSPMKTKYINTEMQISCQQVLLQRLGTICMSRGC